MINLTNSQIEYSKEWFENPENRVHTIQDVNYFGLEVEDKKIIQVGENFLLDLYPVYENGEDRSPTDVEIWEVKNTEKKVYDKIRKQWFNFIPIRKVTTGKQFNYPNGYWRVLE